MRSSSEALEWREMSKLIDGDAAEIRPFNPPKYDKP
jgi:hypothetical protein